jgi:hypothetical protein
MSTAFQIHQDGNNLVCKNQDVIYDGVYLFTNLRGVRKSALIMPPALPLSWTSIYGSLTVSQVGKENPNGGINEAGLVVEQTTLWQTDYPAPDDRPAVGELQWMQYMLDTCSTIQEAVEAAAVIRIDQSTSKLHYLLADRTGDCAVIEYIQGSMVVHREGLLQPIIANSPYARAMADIEAGHTDWTGQEDYERNSMQRLLTTTKGLGQGLAGSDAVEYAFRLLSQARREDTVFSLVYDLDRMELYAKTSRKQARIKICIADFDFSGASPSLAADLQLLLPLSPQEVKEQFSEYSTEFNLRAVQSFFRDPMLTSVFQWQISDEMIHFLAHYPESCT